MLSLALSTKAVLFKSLRIFGTYSSIYLLYILTAEAFYYACFPHSFGELFTSLISQLSPVCSGLNYIQGNILKLFQNSFGIALTTGIDSIWGFVGK